MRKYLYTAAVAALALAIAVPAKAEEKAAKAAAKAPEQHQVTGTIEKIEADSVTVKNNKGELTVVVTDAKTKIATADKKEGAALADLKVSDKVLARYVVQDGKNVAKSIVTPPPAPKAKKEGEKKK